MSRTTTKQGQKSGWRKRDAAYRQQQKDRRKAKTIKRQARALFNLMAGQS